MVDPEFFAQVYGRYGLINKVWPDDPYLIDAVRRAIYELGFEEHPLPDFEHETVFVSTSDQWGVAVQMSGLATFNRRYEPPLKPLYLRDLPLDQLESLLVSAAKGDLEAVESYPWKSREETPPFRRDFYLYASEPLMTPLHKAALLADTAWIAELIQDGADLNARNEEGSTPLHCVALAGRLEICRLLLDAGAKPDAQTENGSTPMDYARRQPKIRKLIQRFLDRQA